ncbi:uncharacterized mitochondrial protein AtMg00810-like [Beta vulgaris subsp. vulgaris]|uniref:uncharacterized mitochondrial protein AtMg00810-like n=1 Tax=Beta vulgaris subsp. vulgaris TaxID=3555 RepID=UPI0009015EA0|nr:uncharacterized mitochondrial protein AtMg00810-like [Beta vulgaris subsp. vulgaris]
MKDSGNIRYFLGIEVDKSDASFFISQNKYVMNLLKEFHMPSAKGTKPPMDPQVKLLADSGEYLPDPTPYQHLIGKLIYLTITRLDIAFTVHTLSQFMNKPYASCKTCAKIPKKLSRQGVLLASSSAVVLTAYLDSDWTGCPLSRKSTTGFCVLLGKSPILWKTKKQKMEARSAAEAEYRAMALTTCGVVCLTQLLKKLGIKFA